MCPRGKWNSFPLEWGLSSRPFNGLIVEELAGDDVMTLSRNSPDEFHCRVRIWHDPPRMIAGLLAVLSTWWALLLAPFLTVPLISAFDDNVDVHLLLWLWIIVPGYAIYVAWWYRAIKGSTVAVNRRIWICSTIVNAVYSPLLFAGLFRFDSIAWLWWILATALSIVGSLMEQYDA